jgi:hypothetical protein
MGGGVGVWRCHVRAEGGHVATARLETGRRRESRRRTLQMAVGARRLTRKAAAARQESPPERLVAVHAWNFFFLPSVSERCVPLASHMGDGDGWPEGRGALMTSVAARCQRPLHPVWLYIGDAYRHRCIVIHSRLLQKTSAGRRGVAMLN